VHLSWKGRRTIGEIQLTVPTAGIAAPPTRVLITSPDGTRDVPVPSSGILRFPPLTTDRLDISFPGIMPATAYNQVTGRAEQLPVGLGALTIPALASLRTGTAAATASFRLGCGQGPPLTIDGRTYPTSVSGTVRDLISLTPLPLRVCTGGSVLTLPTGRHWLSSPGTGLPVAITDLSLTNVATVPTLGPTPGPASAASARGLRIGIWGAEYRTVAIGPGGLSYLEVHQAANPGWTATMNGHRLTPVTLDGWQQAFVLPAGAGGTVVMTFSPATGYHWLLAGSVFALCVLITAAAWPPRREPRGRATSAGAVAGPAGYWLGAVAAALALALAGGLVAIAVPAVILLGWWRRQWVPWLAFAAMCVAGAAVIAGLGHGAQPGFGSFGWPAQAAALSALAAALVPPVPRPWRSRPADVAAAPEDAT
jgi:arabinofuranan 3-O-arabinosyltransferase